MRFVKRRALILLAVVALGVSLWVCRTRLLRSMGAYLTDASPPSKVDYALVLGGGIETRPFVAAAMHSAGLAGKVLISSVQDHPKELDTQEPSEQELTRRVLVQRGVPSSAIVTLPQECGSTIDEAVALREFLLEHPNAKIAIVTNDYHTRRAGRLFRRTLLPEQAAQIVVVAAPTDGFDETDWWRHSMGWQLYTLEYAKLGYSLVFQ